MYFHNFSQFFHQNLHILQQRIQAVYAANLVTIFGLINKLQQFEVQSTIFLSEQDVDVDGKHGRRQIASMAISQYNLFKTSID